MKNYYSDLYEDSQCAFEHENAGVVLGAYMVKRTIETIKNLYDGFHFFCRKTSTDKFEIVVTNENGTIAWRRHKGKIRKVWSLSESVYEALLDVIGIILRSEETLFCDGPSWEYCGRMERMDDGAYIVCKD